jgi:hypothetical protein
VGFSSQGGAVLVKTQAVKGTFPADFDATAIGVKLRSGALGASRDLLIPDPEIGGGRDTADAYLGAISFSGDYEFYARMESVGSFLAAALGVTNSALVTGVGTHTITPSDAAQLPYIAVQEQIGAGLDAFNYTDAVVNTFHLEAEANGYLMGTAGLIARTQLPVASPVASPEFDNTPMTVGTNITATYNGVTVPAKSFSLDINNNFEDDDFRLGSFFLGDLTPKTREITAQLSIRHDSKDIWRQATYGSSAAVAPGGIATKQPLVITMTTYEDIVGSTPLTKASLQFTIPKAIISPFAYGPSGDDILENDIDLRGLRPDPANPILTAVLKNSLATLP